MEWFNLYQTYQDDKLKELGITKYQIYKFINNGELIKRKRKKYYHSDISKSNISNIRKKWLADNPDQHPWKKDSKFKSVPCEFLKSKLRNYNIDFVEEVSISKDRHFSVDILIPSKSLIIEVNGNQHYDKLGKLTKYYQDRHDFIESLGWKIIEIHYSICYNFEIILDLINKSSNDSIILPFYKRELISKRIYKNREDYIKSKNIKLKNANQDLIALVLTSNIDFSKFGWVGKVSKLTGITSQHTSKWVKRYIPQLYERCFKRK